MKLLFVSPFPHGPNAGHGGSAAGWAQLEALRHRHELALVSFEEVGPFAFDATPNVAAVLEKEGIQYRGVPLAIGRWDSRRARMRAVFTQRPVDAEVRRSQRMVDEIHRTVIEFRPDAVVIQFPQMAQYVEACGGVPAFMDVIDARSVSAFRSIGTASTPRIRFQRFVDWLRWVRYESDCYRRFRAVITLTLQDLYGLKAYSPQLDGAAVGVPVTVVERRPENRSGKFIRFVGNFQHPPNGEAVRYFVSHVFPLVRARLPEAVLEVGGRNPPADLTAHAGPGVRFAGFVSDITGFLADASVVAIPLVSGGGLKIKTLEALAAGAAVVSTSIGVEGIEGEDGVHYLVRDGPGAMAESIVSLLSQPQTAFHMREQARSLMLTRYSPAAWEARFTGLIARFLGEPQSGPPGATGLDA